MSARALLATAKATTAVSHHERGASLPAQAASREAVELQHIVAQSTDKS